jgi:hypothetical protein
MQHELNADLRLQTAERLGHPTIDSPKQILALIDANFARRELTDYHLAHSARDFASGSGKNDGGPDILSNRAGAYSPKTGMAIFGGSAARIESKMNSLSI